MSEQRSPGVSGRGGAAPRLDNAAVPMIIVGALLAVLAPLAGFLGGTVVAQPDAASTSTVQPLYLWLFAGLVIGGIGALVAFLGGLRWVRANRGRL